MTLKHHTIAFTEWLTSADSPYAIMHGEKKRLVAVINDELIEYTIEQVYDEYIKQFSTNE